MKEIIKKYIKLHQEHATALYRIIPVGGYLQTAILAKNTRRQLHSQSKVYAILDEDAFTIPDTQNPEFVRLRSKNRDLIYSLRCTPELWIIDKFEKRNLAVQKAIRAKFGCEYQNLINAPKYQACNSPSPRRLAKYKTNVLIDLLKEYSGETEDNIFARLASILIEQHLPNEEIDNFMRQFFN